MNLLDGDTADRAVSERTVGQRRERSYGVYGSTQLIDVDRLYDSSTHGTDDERIVGEFYCRGEVRRAVRRPVAECVHAAYEMMKLARHGSRRMRRSRSPGASSARCRSASKAR